MPIYCLEGNIGGGKTTLQAAVEEYLKLNNISGVKVVYEPVEIWQTLGILEKYYEDPKRWGYMFQNMAFITKIMELHKMDKSDTIYIVERSPMTDRNCFAELCYENGNISEMEWTVYNFWFDHFIKNLKFDGYIYIVSTPEICMEHIKIRNRGEETGIKIEYLQALHDKHEKWLRNTSENILYIEDNYTLEKIDDVVLKVLDFVRK
jgi:deoxyadenosine/deoxycytidine kinase